MPENKKLDKIYLLPQTIGYYQMELTRLLEFERYHEAVELLQFLLNCDTGDDKAREDWQSLLDWMQTMIPAASEDAGGDEDSELSEDDLFLLHIRAKAEQDPDYVLKLLEVFKRHDSWDKQVLALEQLRYLQHPRIFDVLLDWLENRMLPPILQFRTMQILKQKKAGQTMVKLKRDGKKYIIDLRDVPASPEEYPWPFQNVLNLVMESEFDSGIPLQDFAQQTWSEFIAYIFGTPVYAEIMGEPPEVRQAWAAAFHYTLLRSAGQAPESVDQLKGAYGISGQLEKKWSKAIRVFAEFGKAVFPSMKQ